MSVPVLKSASSWLSAARLTISLPARMRDKAFERTRLCLSKSNERGDVVADESLPPRGRVAVSDEVATSS